MTKRVKRCTNSTLKEAWVTLEGGPSLEENYRLEDKVSALVHNIRTKVLDPKNTEYKDTQRNLIQLVEVPEKGVLPYWHTEFRWFDGKSEKIIRAGNNFLGFHTLHSDENQKYHSYVSDLKPLIEEAAEKIDEGNDFEVQRVIFRYINIFHFDYANFNLGDYFDVISSIKLNDKLIPLTGLLAKFNFKSSQEDAVLNLEFRIHPAVTKMILSAETTGLKALSENRSVTDSSLLDEIEDLKNQTKDAFFGCTKSKTNDILGVEYEQ